MITAGQFSTGLGSLSALVVALESAYVTKFASLPDDAVILEDAADVASIAWPPAGAIAIGIALLVELEPIAAASGFTIGPDPDPEVDAQMHTGTIR